MNGNTLIHSEGIRIIIRLKQKADFDPELVNAGRLRSNDEKSREVLHFTAFLASPARFERTAFRLGGEQTVFAVLLTVLPGAGESIYF